RLRGQAFIHIWDAGCAHGPEPYTMAILLRERMSDYVFRNVRIHASDIDPGFAQSIQSGMFRDEELGRIPTTIMERYFVRCQRAGYRQIVPELREKVTFYHHDLLSLRPVRENLSIVVCKNVLLHLTESERRAVLRMFHDALRDDGLLVMEHTQKLPDELQCLYQSVASHGKVYRKVARPGVGEPLRAPHFAADGQLVADGAASSASV
ncbi:MAG: CheR family methyltransferase, partial [Planctomycetota bacterium]